MKPPNKAPSTKTMDKRLHEWQFTAPFLYLNDHCGFHQFPTAADDDRFVERLLRSANDLSELKRFFGAYAFVQESLGSGSWLDRVLETIPRVAIEAAPFTRQELAIIGEYEANNFLLGNYQPGDDD